MSEIKIKDRQTLLDIALTTSGSLDSVFDLATTNNISVTDVLVDSNLLSTVGVVNAKYVSKYQKEDISPATELTADDKSCMATEGIGFMCIEGDANGKNYFVIS